MRLERLEGVIDTPTSCCLNCSGTGLTWFIKHKRNGFFRGLFDIFLCYKRCPSCFGRGYAELGGEG